MDRKAERNRIPAILGTWPRLTYHSQQHSWTGLSIGNGSSWSGFFMIWPLGSEWFLSLQLTQPLEEVWGVVWVIGYRGKRMEIKPLAECQQQPEGGKEVPEREIPERCEQKTNREVDDLYPSGPVCYSTSSQPGLTHLPTLSIHRPLDSNSHDPLVHLQHLVEAQLQVERSRCSPENECRQRVFVLRVPLCVRFLSGRWAAQCHVVVSQELQAKRGDRGKHEKYMIIMPPH
ncbi:unnamed protein product [Leuciscus chuanchicus]